VKSEQESINKSREECRGNKLVFMGAKVLIKRQDFIEEVPTGKRKEEIALTERTG